MQFAQELQTVLAGRIQKPVNPLVGRMAASYGPRAHVRLGAPGVHSVLLRGGQAPNARLPAADRLAQIVQWSGAIHHRSS